MSDHRATSRTRRGWFTSVRVRALLSLGIALGIGSVGTFAFWTDDVVISGTTFTAGTIDLRVNGADSLPSYTTLNMSNAVPGNTIAGVLTIRNQGSAPLKYTRHDDGVERRRQERTRVLDGQGHRGDDRDGHISDRNVWGDGDHRLRHLVHGSHVSSHRGVSWRPARRSRSASR